MIRMVFVTLLALAHCVGLAPAQTVFVDEFDGDDLAPHWNRPPPSVGWEYNVSGGMLNVTGLFHPGIPDVPNNSAIIGTALSPQDDFHVSVRMGWDPGENRGIHFNLTSSGTIIAQFGYWEWFGPPHVFVQGQSPAFAFTPPDPGLHEFSVQRSGNVVEFILNGQPLHALSESVTRPLTTISLAFTGPNLGPMAPLFVDSVHIVPAPAASLVLILAGSTLFRRR